MIVFFFGSGIFLILGVIAILLLGLSHAFAVWVVENAVTIGIILLIIHIFYSLGVISELSKNVGFLLGVVLGLLFALPQIFVVTTGYHYLMWNIEVEGFGGAILDIAVCWGIYFVASNLWNRLVIRNGAGPAGAIFLTLLHCGISVFFLYMFITYPSSSMT